MERPGRDYSLGCLPIIGFAVAGLVLGLVIGWSFGSQPGTDVGGMGHWPDSGVVKTWTLLGLLIGASVGACVAWFTSGPPNRNH